jgi:excisionase family DNA binding protein
MENQSFNIKEVSNYLKCSISGIRNLVRNKKIPFYRIGNRLFFKKSSIDLWINNQEYSNMKETDYQIKIKPLKREVS